MSFEDLTSMCVEDEPLVLLELSKLLTEMGFGTVLIAHRLDEAFAHLERTRVDFAILDYDLGFGDRTTELGLALAGMGAKVLFSSGYEKSSLDPRLHDFDFVEKPAMAATLRERITALLSEQKKAGPGGPAQS